DTGRPLIKEIKFGTDPRKGKLESFYHLTNRGKNELLENRIVEEESILMPKGTSTMFANDYEHRKMTIDCHIACVQSCDKEGIELLQFDRYFDKTGNNRSGKNLKAKTSIVYPGGYIIADGSFLIKKGGTSRLYALEVYNDRNTKRIVGQLYKHVEGIKDSSLCQHFGIEKGHRVCCVFSHEGIMKQVMERFEGEEYSKYFLFRYSKSTHSSFLQKWWLIEKGEFGLIG
ncbi:MAG: hypothetical protein DWQ02_16625, partial [Bacteroidetes bacterium]